MAIYWKGTWPPPTPEAIAERNSGLLVILTYGNDGFLVRGANRLKTYTESGYSVLRDPIDKHILFFNVDCKGHGLHSRLAVQVKAAMSAGRYFLRLAGLGAMSPQTIRLGQSYGLFV